jgi:hypothetical protein
MSENRALRGVERSRVPAGAVRGLRTGPRRGVFLPTPFLLSRPPSGRLHRAGGWWTRPLR